MSYDPTDFDDYEDPDVADLRAEVASSSRYEQALRLNPDCRDPDHPGCSHCQEDE